MTWLRDTWGYHPFMNESAIPKAPGLPLLGVALKFGPEWVRATRERLGDVFSFELPGGNGGVMVTHPDDVRLALVDNKGVTRAEFPPHMHSVLAPITGDGLIGRSGAAWTERRGMMQPSFRRQRLAELVPIMLGAIDQHLESFESRFVREGRPFDALPEMHALTLSILIRSLLGPHIDARDIARAREAVDLTMKAATFAPIEFGKQRLAHRAARAFEEVSMRIIQERRASPAEARPRDLLTAMIEMQDAHGGGLDDTSIRARLLQRYSVEWADTRPVTPKVIFNTRFPRRVPIRLVPRA
jgi:cytochrome P450